MQTAETVLTVIRERGRRGLPLKRLYRQLFNRDLYLVAYGNLYANQGAMTRGATRETVDGMSLAKIDRIIAALRRERYRWTPVRRVLRTLANKHRASVRAMWWQYRATVLTEHGPRRCLQARIDRPGKEPLVARFGGLPLRRKTDTVLKDRVTLFGPRRTELSKRLLADTCELCGRKDANAEVHHVRKLANLNKPGRKVLPDWKKVMIARRRKTLVVCHACHQAIHAGSPVGQRLSD